MTNNKRNFSIGLRISGTIALLLSFMMAVVLFDYQLTQRIDNRLELLSEHIIPITKHLSEIEISALEQELLFEQLQRSSVDKKLELTALFNELGAQIDDDVKSAKLELKQALAGDNISAAKIELAKISPLLDIIELEHQDLQDHFLEFATLPNTTNAEIRQLRQQQLDIDAQEFNHMLDKAYKTLGNFSSDEATAVTIAETNAHEIAVLVALLTFITGLALSPIITKQIIRPLRELSQGVHNVAQGDLSVIIPIHSEDEIGQLSNSFNSMVEDLKLKQSIKQIFGKFVDPRIVDKLLDQDGELNSTGNNKQIMTVFFSDIVKFSPISESLTPTALVKLINHYFSTVAQPIIESNGVVDKFIGDAVMAFWGPPFISHQGFAQNACSATLQQIRNLEKLNRDIPELLEIRHNPPKIDIRVGLCTGEVVAGNIGSKDIMSYTLMGDTVNIASRLESANKFYQTQVLLDHNTFNLIRTKFVTRCVDKIQVVGIKEALTVYELLGETAKVSIEQQAIKQHYEAGLQAYLQQDWDFAQQNIQQALAVNPDDGPSKVLSARIIKLQQSPVDKNWDGVWSWEKK